MKIDISIIIVSWNAKRFLLECLQSIFSKGLSHSLEILVVDNASSDGSAEAVQEQFPDVNIIKNNENLGFAKANNIGIMQSRGKYVCLINSDVKILSGCLDSLCDYMDNHPSIGMLGPRIYWSDMTLQSSCRMFPSLWNNFCSAVGLNRIFPEYRIFSGEHMFFFKHDKIRPVQVLVGCFMMARREAVNKVGLLDERFFIYAEDIDWCKRFREAGWEILFYPGAEAIHYGRSSSSNDPLRFTGEQMRAVLQYWEKHHGMLKRTIFLLILFIHYAGRIIICALLDLIKPKHRKDTPSQLSNNIVSVQSIFRLLMHRR